MNDNAILASPPTSFNALRDEIHAENVQRGWWTNPRTGASIIETRDRGNMIALVHSEVSESVDGFWVHGLVDDHLPHRRMAEVEMADCVIRLMDMAGADRIDFDGTLVEMDTVEHFMQPEHDLLLLHRDLSYALEGYRKNTQHVRLTHRRTIEVELTKALKRIMLICDDNGFDLWAAVAEKRAYNGRRADHKVENRIAAGGKQF